MASEATKPVQGGEWWRRGVFYQIYPRSFQDSNGDGIGDLQGIIDRLDYLNDGTERSLGIDAIWLSPTFPSPMADFGYDVSDYCGVHPDFGDLETMDRLIAACHARGIRLLLDFVPNHSSDQHPWFVESRRSRENPKRDWYCWRDAKPDGGPPNNWVGVFGGSAWEWDERTQQYYLHSFLVEQPDLNWRNPEVVQAMHDVLRFWLRRGIDGFRVDVMGRVLKDPLLRDNPPNPHPDPNARYREGAAQLQVYNRNWPEVFDAARAMRQVVDEFPERMLVGEVFGPPETIARFYGEQLDGLNLAFNFGLIGGYDNDPHTAWEAEIFRRVIESAELALPEGAWPCFALGNHDRPRLVTRYGADGRGQERARAAAVLLLTLRGTPFLYYGDEIGMPDIDVPPEQEQDPARFHTLGRDPERTPMQWDDSSGRGFTTGKPWLPFGDPAINVAAQQHDSDSLLSLYRRLIRLRKQSPALHSGSYQTLPAPAGVFAYERRAPAGDRAVVAINFETSPADIALPELGAVSRILLSTDRRRDRTPVSGGAIELAPLEACIVG